MPGHVEIQNHLSQHRRVRLFTCATLCKHVQAALERPKESDITCGYSEVSELKYTTFQAVSLEVKTEGLVKHTRSISSGLSC